MASFQTSARTKVSHARSSCQNNLNDDTKGKGALRVTLRAFPKPGPAIEQ